MHGNVPIFDMWHAFRHHEIWVDLGDICRNSFKFFSDKSFFLGSARRQIPLFANQKKDLVRIELTFLQEVSIIVRVNMKPRRIFFIHFCSSSFLSSRSNICLSFFRWFPRFFFVFFCCFFLGFFFCNLHDIDFALSCMDVLAINAHSSINWNSKLNFVKFNRIIFKQYPSSYWHWTVG